MKPRTSDRGKRRRSKVDAGADSAPAEIDANRTARRILFFVFALSGLTGLVYEATWTRYLQLFLGHAAYAQVLVLSIFMGGMALGALVAPRLGRGAVAPLIAYAAIEALLGLAALAFHPIFDAVTTFTYAELLPASEGSAAVFALQWLLGAALILPQSILLGMTFPMMSASVLRLGSERGGRVFAMLYFTNSAGAVIGVLLAGFWLTEAYGLRMTMVAAGLGNLVVAAVAAAIARRRVTVVPAVERSAAAETVGRWPLVFAFATGASSFFYEIGWLRMLALVQGASTHAFETMLSAFILGLALGGLWIRGRIERYASPLFALARVQILMGIAALATLPAYNYAFDIVASALATLPRTDAGYLGYSAVGFGISAGIMLPAAFFAGMTLPLLTYILYSQGRGESDIGAVYGWNTLGAIAGTAAGGLILMPLIGLKELLVAGAAVDIALGLALAAVLVRRRELVAPRTAMVLAAISVIALVAATTAFDLDVTRMASGVFRSGQARIDEGTKVAFHADGRTATVDVTVAPNGRTSIATNGKVDASIDMRRARGDLTAPAGVDEYTMTLLAALPLAYAPDARRVAIIGFGSGLTTHVVLASPRVERADVIEIELEMVRGARAFLPRVERAYEDRRARLYIEDARAFFARARERYDIIISEPSNPWVSGVSTLFTPEFYRQAKRALNTNGLFVQWFHTYEIDRRLVVSIVRAIAEVFPDYVLYAPNESDVILVAGAPDALPSGVDTLFGWPQMREQLEYLDIRTPADFGIFRLANRRAYAPLLEAGRANTDYHPVLEFGAARTRFLKAGFPALTQNARDPVPVLEILSHFPPPELPAPSRMVGSVNPRFVDVARARVFAESLATGQLLSDASAIALLEGDPENLETVRAVAKATTPRAWHAWFGALFTLSKPMIPNGGGPALERYVRSEPVASALSGAPEDVRDKVEFLLRVSSRDLEGMRREGAHLLEGSVTHLDPAFGAYTLFATAAACLASASPDPSCRKVLARLDGLPPRNPVIDVLRAHKATLP